jgi:hypothetical protein
MSLGEGWYGGLRGHRFLFSTTTLSYNHFGSLGWAGAPGGGSICICAAEVADGAARADVAEGIQGIVAGVFRRIHNIGSFVT